MVAPTAVITINSGTTLSAVQAAYREKFEAYIKSGVFMLQTVDYYKCLSMFYEISGVVSVNSFQLNGAENSVAIGEKQIQVCGDISVGVA